MPDVSLDSLQSGANYPQWATEESLQKLLRITEGTPRYHSFMQKFAAKMSRGGGDIADVMKTAADEMKEWSREVKKASRDSKGSGKSTTFAAESASQLGSAASTAATRLGAMAKSAARTDATMTGAYNSLTGILSMVSTMIEGGVALAGSLKKPGPKGGKSTLGKAMGTTANMASSAITAMAAGLGVAMTIIDDFGQSLRKTGDLGVSFGESFMDLRVQLGEAGLGLDNLEKQLALNSTAFALLGDNVQAGIRAWVDWRKQFVKEGDMEFFTNLGFAIEDLNDYFLKDTRNRILAGRSREQATDEATESLRDLARNTKAVSELTGESRKKLMQAVIERESDAKWQAYLGSLPTEEAGNLQDSLRNMVTLYGLSEKQQKAVQDAIRMGGDVSLLAENIFGDAFSDWKFMPDALNELQGTVQRVATGERIGDEEFRRIAMEWHKANMEFWDTPQGKLIAQVGGSIIDFAAGFAARQQSILVMQNQAAFLAGGMDLTKRQAGSPMENINESLGLVGNITLQSGQQIGAILQNAFAMGVTKEMTGVIEKNLGDLVLKREAAVAADATDADKEAYRGALLAIEETFGAAGVVTGWVSSQMAQMAITSAEFVIQGAVSAIKFMKKLDPGVAIEFLKSIFPMPGGVNGMQPSANNIDAQRSFRDLITVPDEAVVSNDRQLSPAQLIESRRGSYTFDQDGLSPGERRIIALLDKGNRDRQHGNDLAENNTGVG